MRLVSITHFNSNVTPTNDTDYSSLRKGIELVYPIIQSSYETTSHHQLLIAQGQTHMYMFLCVYVYVCMYVCVCIPQASALSHPQLLSCDNEAQVRHLQNFCMSCMVFSSVESSPALICKRSTFRLIVGSTQILCKCMYTCTHTHERTHT